jgi:hypothetical protein
MDPKTFLSRQIDVNPCKLVGNRIRTIYQKIQLEDGPLPQRFEAKYQRLDGVTIRIETTLPDGLSLKVIDRGADRGIGGFAQTLLGIGDALHEPESGLPPISPQGRVRAQKAQQLYLHCFPNGTGYLSADTDTQWGKMRELDQILDKAEVQSLISDLGLQEEVGRVKQWIQLYDRRKTQPPQEELHQRLQRLAVEWLEAYAELLFQAFAFYDEPQNSAHQARRDALLAPYLEEVEKEREADRQYRKREAEAKKKAAEEKQAAEGKKDEGNSGSGS